jgi:hypothetical protein
LRCAMSIILTMMKMRVRAPTVTPYGRILEFGMSVQFFRRLWIPIVIGLKEEVGKRERELTKASPASSDSESS